MQRGFGLIPVIVGIVIIASIAAGGYYFFQQQQIKSINSYEECAKHYPVMLSYPGQCRTPDGRTFVQPLSDEEKKKLVPPTESTPSADEIANWKTYKSEKLGFSFSYPSDLLIKEDYLPRETINPQIGNVMIYVDNSDQILSFNVLNNPEMQSAESWWNSNFARLYEGDKDPVNNQPIKREDFKTSYVKLGNVQAFYTENDKFFSSPYYINHKETIITVISSLNIQVRDQILDTFKFLDASSSPTATSKNQCGDGVCQEVTCQAIGCPKPETSQNCPQDCKSQ